MSLSPFPPLLIGDLHIATASRKELTEMAIKDCAGRDRETRRPRLVFDLNGHALSLQATDRAYKKALVDADVIHADGGFIVSISQLIGKHPIRERSATTDMIHDFAAAAAQVDQTFYLLGGTEQVNRDCATILQKMYPRLQIVGRRNGFFDDDDAVVKEISACNPDYLWIGLGKPKEQDFAARNRTAIRAGWAITCGGCFNYITGGYTRAPMWMQRANIEWLHRAVTTPRLISRYLSTSPRALYIALTQMERRNGGRLSTGRSQ